jgi:hypothetical protein
MRATKVVGHRKAPKTPAEFYALGAQLDREAKLLSPSPRGRGFVFKAKTWDELQRWEDERARARHRKLRHR